MISFINHAGKKQYLLSIEDLENVTEKLPDVKTSELSIVGLSVLARNCKNDKEFEVANVLFKRSSVFIYGKEQYYWEMMPNENILLTCKLNEIL